MSVIAIPPKKHARIDFARCRREVVVSILMRVATGHSYVEVSGAYCVCRDGHEGACRVVLAEYDVRSTIEAMDS